MQDRSLQSITTIVLNTTNHTHSTQNINPYSSQQMPIHHHLTSTIHHPSTIQAKHSHSQKVTQGEKGLPQRSKCDQICEFI